MLYLNKLCLNKKCQYRRHFQSKVIAEIQQANVIELAETVL